MSDRHSIEAFEASYTARTLREWVGSTPNAHIPDKVRARVFLKCEGKCAHCRRIVRIGDKPQLDHIVALVNGGQHAEGNLQLLCGLCHAAKTKGDVREKSVTRRKMLKTMGLSRPKRKMPYRKFDGTPVNPNKADERR